MLKTLAIAAVALATAMAFGHTTAQAQNTQEKTGRVIQQDSGPQQKIYWCVKPNTKAYVQCTKAEQEQFQARTRKERQEKEMAAEQRAYDKMKKERQQKATTTEHCYMKNGQLECKQVP